jgi:hypothetical protein
VRVKPLGNSTDFSLTPALSQRERERESFKSLNLIALKPAHENEERTPVIITLLIKYLVIFDKSVKLLIY